MTRVVFLRSLTVLLTALVATNVHQAVAQTRDGTTQNLIVKFKDSATKRGLAAPTRVAMLSADSSIALSHVRAMAMDADVVALDRSVSLAEAEAIASRLASNPAVEYAEPDRWVKSQFVPDDELIGTQTYLLDNATGISAYSAWDITRGSPGVVVAVLDTGYRPHAGLESRFLPGYDFISNVAMANDGDGRDTDASDPGDWVTRDDIDGPLAGKNCSVGDSSWHGTAVAGIIGANTNDGILTAGIDWSARILPVRVLGKCGGSTSDIVDGLAWAAGLRVPGVPLNPTPAHVINLSLGEDTTGNCLASEQSAINAALANGITKAIVVAAGNEAQDVARHAPANCNGVISVAATTSRGGRTSYSNYGATITISAPGGDFSLARGLDGIEVLGNSGIQGPQTDSAGIKNGTSFSAPMVSAVISLMLSVAPSLSVAEVRSILTSSAKRFLDNMNCTTQLCGAGILDAHAAVAAAQASQPQVVNYEGLWWNAPAGSESGWGINLAHQGDTIFATWFTYDGSGKPWWLSMTAPRVANGTYAGTLNVTHGPAFNAVPFDPAAVAVTPVGSGTLAFADSNSGTFSYTVNGIAQTKAIVRQVFAALPSCSFGAQPNLALATNYQDLWWKAPAGSESGWGLNLTQQSNTVFATWFTYDSEGSPLWLSATLNASGTGEYVGTLLRTAGPPFNAVPFDPARVTATPVGSVTLRFADGNDATFAYTLNGISQSKPITRQVFQGPGTVCR